MKTKYSRFFRLMMKINRLKRNTMNIHDEIYIYNDIIHFKTFYFLLNNFYLLHYKFVNNYDVLNEKDLQLYLKFDFLLIFLYNM